MKKLLILLALCMAFSLLLVACNNNDEPEEPTDEVTTEEETDAPTEKETEKESETTTETETTTEGTTEPPVVVADPVTVKVSIDELRKMVDGADVADDGVFSPGQFANWDKTAKIDHTLSGLKFWGWVGFFAETVGEFGYQIGSEDPVYSADFVVEAEKEVVDAATGAGAKSAARMAIVIPTAQLEEGNVTVKIFVKDAKGSTEEICSFTLTKTLPFEDDKHTGFALDSVLLNGEAFVKVENENDTVEKLFNALKNTVSVRYTGIKETISISGWASFKDAPAVEFGYYLGDNYNIITSPDFIVERPDLTETEATTEPSSESTTEGTTAEEKKIENGMGYNVTIPINELTYGTYRAGIVAKMADGTFARVFEFYVTIEYLGVDTETLHISSVDTINGNGPVGEDGKYGLFFTDLGGTATGKLDAAAAGKTTNKDGFITLNGWFGVSGGVNRYVWSIDGGKTWIDFTEGAKDGEPMEGFYHSVSNGIESTQNGLFDALTIDLSAHKGETLNLWVGAVANLNLDDVIVICEISNLRVVETTAYDAENNTVTVPAGFVTKQSVSGVAGKILNIEKTEGLVVKIDNSVEVITLTANKEGAISYEISAELDAFDIVIENTTDTDVEATVVFIQPPVDEGTTAAQE